MGLRNPATSPPRSRDVTAVIGESGKLDVRVVFNRNIGTLFCFLLRVLLQALDNVCVRDIARQLVCGFFHDSVSLQNACSHYMFATVQYCGTVQNMAELRNSQMIRVEA